MTEYVEITIPSITETGQEIPEIVRLATIDDAALYFADIFGGATTTDGVGYYQHDDGRLAREIVTVVKAYVLDHIDVDRQHDLRRLAGGIRRELSQESVLLNINGDVTFI